LSRRACQSATREQTSQQCNLGTLQHPDRNQAQQRCKAIACDEGDPRGQQEDHQRFDVERRVEREPRPDEAREHERHRKGRALRARAHAPGGVMNEQCRSEPRGAIQTVEPLHRRTWQIRNEPGREDAKTPGSDPGELRGKLRIPRHRSVETPVEVVSGVERNTGREVRNGRKQRRESERDEKALDKPRRPLFPLHSAAE
jgi:hypothetical protein